MRQEYEGRKRETHEPTPAGLAGGMITASSLSLSEEREGIRSFDWLYCMGSDVCESRSAERVVLSLPKYPAKPDNLDQRAN